MVDYLIIGSGLYGATFASEMTRLGKRCVVLEKRSHIGGNAYTETIEGIQVHQYGAHIFHTNDACVWTFVNRFAAFNHFINSPMANYKGTLYNLPFNMNTFYKMWGEPRPAEVLKILNHQRAEIHHEPRNLEEQAIRLVGRDVYEVLIKGYTEKQWGRSCEALPPFIINRLPVRLTYDNNYFSDRYQGIPVGGYTKLIQKMLEGVEVHLNTDYFERRAYWQQKAKMIVYTGPIDAYFDYCYGPLAYRTVRFETEVLDMENYQGVAVVNFTEAEVPFTRIIEHKHFEFGTQAKTVISKEYSEEWHLGMEPYYPVNNEENQQLFTRYQALASNQESVIFGGRLADYRYYNMDQVIANALECVQMEKEKWGV